MLLVPLTADGQSLDEEPVRRYLSTDATSIITSLVSSKNRINISGSAVSLKGSNPQLIEFPPYVSSINPKHAIVIAPIENQGEFQISLDRCVEGRDRSLSRWTVLATHDEGDTDAFCARYHDDLRVRQQVGFKSKKGLGGVHAGDDLPELLELGVSHITVNVHLEKLIASTSKGAIRHEYCGKPFYFRPGRVAQFDKVFSFATEHDIVSSAILLVPRLNRNSELGQLLTHPEAVDGHFSMPNLTNAESAQLFAAIIDFLAKRYSGKEAKHGRITNWILGNEIDAGWVWTNAGELTAHEYMDQYVRALRMVHTIARSHNPHSKAFISLTHSWTQPIESNPLRFYPGRKLIEILQRYCEVEGDFDWGVAYHPYPQDLFQPRFWQDDLARDDFDSPKVTFRNIQVLDRWLHQPRYLYDGRVRTVLLSEQGFHTPDYSEESERVQAAALALSWQKIQTLETVQAYHYHRWIDHPGEGGLLLGLRRLADPTASELHPKKFSWEVFRAFGTPGEAEAMEFARSIVDEGK